MTIPKLTKIINGVKFPVIGCPEMVAVGETVMVIIGLAIAAPDYFVKTDNVKLVPLNLSTYNRSVFETPFFNEEYVGVNDVSSYATPSQADFLKDDKSDGAPMGDMPKKMLYLGSANKLNYGNITTGN